MTKTSSRTDANPDDFKGLDWQDVLRALLQTPAPNNPVKPSPNKD